MNPFDLSEAVARLTARPEPVTKVYVLFSYSCLAGGVSRMAWLDRGDAEKHRATLLSDLGLDGDKDDPDAFIRIVELTIYKRGINGGNQANQDQAALTLHPEVLESPGASADGEDQGRPGA